MEGSVKQTIQRIPSIGAFMTHSFEGCQLQNNNFRFYEIVHGVQYIALPTVVMETEFFAQGADVQMLINQLFYESTPRRFDLEKYQLFLYRYGHDYAKIRNCNCLSFCTKYDVSSKLPDTLCSNDTTPFTPSPRWLLSAAYETNEEKVCSCTSLTAEKTFAFSKDVDAALLRHF